VYPDLVVGNDRLSILTEDVASLIDGIPIPDPSGRARGQRVVTMPPSMSTSVPVMLPTVPEARSSTSSATSAGWVNRSVGVPATAAAFTAAGSIACARTFFRHFPDKREILVAGQETLSRLLTEGIAEAPGNASPLEAVAAGLERAATAMGPVNRELAPRLKAAVAASAELQERDALKSVSLAAAMTTALVARGVPNPTAALAGELGVLAFKRGYTEWSEGGRDAKDELAGYILAALDELRAASASLG
jgi:AcrR family transcriptional regulator